MDASSGSTEIIRLFPSFVWKSRLGREASEPIQRAIFEQLSALRAGLPGIARGEVWQSRHGLHALPELAPPVLHIRRCVDPALAFPPARPPPFEIPRPSSTIPPPPPPSP